MQHRFISPKVHGALDYLLDASLLAIPFLFGFTGAAMWLCFGVGAANIGYSVLTSYRAGVVPLLPFRAHLVFDFVLGAAFVAAPFVLRFEGLAQVVYVLIGVGIMAIVAVTDPNTE